MQHLVKPIPKPNDQVIASDLLFVRCLPEPRGRGVPGLADDPHVDLLQLVGSHYIAKGMDRLVEASNISIFLGLRIVGYLPIRFLHPKRNIMAIWENERYPA